MADDKTNITFQVPRQWKRTLERLAKESGMSPSEYIRRILNPIIDGRGVFHEELKFKGNSSNDTESKSPNK